MPDGVQCSECGMLALLHRQSGEYVAADKLFRDKGEIQHFDTKYIHNPYPFCAANLLDFHVAIGKPNDENDGTRRRATIHEPRQCNGFVPWNPCFSPKEHKEMILSEKMLEIERQREDADRVWREQEAKRQREWQADQAAKAEGRHAENLAVVASGTRWTAGSTILACIVAALALFGATYLGASLARQNEHTAGQSRAHSESAPPGTTPAPSATPTKLAQ